MALKKNNKILLLTDWYYPGYKAGGPIRSCRNLAAALREDFSFYVLTSDRDLGEDMPYPFVRCNMWTEGPAGEKVYYTTRFGMFPNRIRRRVKETGSQTVYLNSMFSFRFTILPLLALNSRRFRGKIVLAPRGMLQQGALSFKPFKKRLFLALFRLLKAHKRILFHATDEQEMSDIERIFPGSRIVLADNIPATGIENKPVAEKEAGLLRMVFFSRLHPKKNLDYLLSALKMEKFRGGLILDVYGEASSAEYLGLCKQIARSLQDGIAVRFHGSLSNDKMLQKMQEYEAFVLPTLGENFGHVIYEALISGVPVLISDKTPWRDLESSKAGWDIPLDQPERFAQKIQELIIMNHQTHMEWRDGARKRAEAYLNQTDFRTKYLQLFQ